MLPHLHTPIESLLRGRGGLPPEVAVECAVPTAEWRGELLGPTICLYMFDMSENAEFRNAGAQTTRANGVATTRMAPRRVDLRYLICAFAGDALDEQALIWRALAVLLSHPTLPPELLPAEVGELGLAVQTRVGPYQDAPRPLDLWGALELPPRPALLYTVTMPLDLKQALEAPLVLSRTLRRLRPSPDDERLGLGVRPGRVARRDGIGAGYAPLPGVVVDGRLSPAELAVAIADEGFTIAGRLCRPGGAPVAGATVRLVQDELLASGGEAATMRRDSSCETSGDGAFVLWSVPGGPATLRVSLPGEPPDRPPPRPDLAVEVPWPFDIVLL